MIIKRYKKISFFILSLVLVIVTTFSSFTELYANSVAYGWAKHIGGDTESYSTAYQVTTDTSGNVYTVGYFSGTVDFDPGEGVVNITSLGGAEMFISKLDSDGDYVWVKILENEEGSQYSNQANSITFDSLGNIYIAGYFSGTVDFDPGEGTTNLTSVSGEDIFILKLDSSGSYLWVKQLGGNGDAFSSQIKLDSNENIYMTGSFSGTMDFDPGEVTVNMTSGGNQYNGFISKFDSDGNYIWAKQMVGSGDNRSNGVYIDSSLNVYTVGNFDGTVDFDPGVGVANLTSVGTKDIFISKIDSDGNYIWAKSMGGTQFDHVNSVNLDSFGNIYTIGYFDGTADFDPGVGVVNLTSAGGQDIFILKLDSSGNYIWARSMGGVGSDYGNSLTLDSLGNIYATGTFSDTVDFDPGMGVFNLTSAGNQDIFVSKLDSDGGYVWVKSMGGENQEPYSYSIHIDSSSSVYTTGYFGGIVDFDPGEGVANLTSGGSEQMFISKLTPVSLPALSSTTSSSTTDSLSLTSSITDTGGALLSERGFQYGTSDSYGNTVTDIGSFDTGSYTTTISSLSCGTTYYFRSFGTNTAGTSYGAASQATTAACPGVVFIPSGGFTPSPALVPSPTTPPQAPVDPSIPPLEQPPTPQQPPIQEPQPVPPVSSSSFPRDITLTSPHMEGDDITTLQTFLHTGGYPIALTPLQERTTRSPIDGIFGPRTQAALKLFQRAKNLIADGIFGEVTKAEILK
jgi:peptidoglycan hydrolase-like protein with peptidoglycan-binding domain